MKKIIALVLFTVILVFVFTFQFKEEKLNSKKDHFGINTQVFKKILKERKYTVLYFWASWCGLSQKGLLDDYSKNYKYINNDTLQSLLIVASDTSSINSFMNRNNINLAYMCLHEAKYPIYIKNILDGRNMESFVSEMFSYDKEISGFPTVLLVDSTMNVLMDSDNTKDAMRICRYFEQKKVPD